ncbi:hypothetical protein [Pontibacter chitinilyticus]|uniref:hypothetical protein n=1 Tax=Pontibacter chitinilyticus TaxID=2674989 RepID=UPI00321970DE
MKRQASSDASDLALLALLFMLLLLYSAYNPQAGQQTRDTAGEQEEVLVSAAPVRST